MHARKHTARHERPKYLQAVQCIPGLKDAVTNDHSGLSVYSPVVLPDEVGRL
jgi:hypothetical protein